MYLSINLLEAVGIAFEYYRNKLPKVAGLCLEEVGTALASANSRMIDSYLSIHFLGDGQTAKGAVMWSSTA